MERMPSLNQLYKYYNDDRLYPWTRTSLDGNLEVLDRVRLMVFEEILKRFPLENKVVLEVGCGSGVFTKAAVVHSKSVTGTDVAKKAIKELALENKDEKLKFITAAAENLPFKRNSFDAVLCFETLEHLKSPVAVLGEIYRVLKPRGRLYVSIPNWFAYDRLSTNNILKKVMFGIKQKIKSQNGMISSHLHFYSPAGWEKLFQHSGFQKIYSRPVFVWPFIPFKTLEKLIFKSSIILKFHQKLETNLLSFWPFNDLGQSHFWVLEKVPAAED